MYIRHVDFKTRKNQKIFYRRTYRLIIDYRLVIIIEHSDRYFNRLIDILCIYVDTLIDIHFMSSIVSLLIEIQLRIEI